MRFRCTRIASAHLLALTKKTARFLNKIYVAKIAQKVFNLEPCSVVRDSVQFEGICPSNLTAGWLLRNHSHDAISGDASKRGDRHRHNGPSAPERSG